MESIRKFQCDFVNQANSPGNGIEELKHCFPDSGKGEVLRWAAGLLFPLFEDAAIAEGHPVFVGDAELGGDAVDPLRGALEFGEDPERGFIHNAVARTLVVSPFGTPLFIAEDRDQSDGGEDLGQGGSIGELSFGFDAVLVPGILDARADA